MGYVKADNLCVETCEGINCGIGGNCFSGNCTCQTGYFNIENVCRENRALIPCQELIFIWQNKGIWNYSWSNQRMKEYDDGSSKFSRTCKPQYLGERFEDDEC